MKILFVCLGNNEPSVMAEALYNKRTDSQNSYSAGVNVSETPRRDEVIRLLADEGIDISKKPKTQLTEKMLNDFDKIYVLCSKEECPSYLLQCERVSFWDVPDPWGKGHEFLLQTKDRIEKLIESIL